MMKIIKHGKHKQAEVRTFQCPMCKCVFCTDEYEEVAKYNHRYDCWGACFEATCPDCSYKLDELITDKK